jgi:hypothetical protein
MAMEHVLPAKPGRLALELRPPSRLLLEKSRDGGQVFRVMATRVTHLLGQVTEVAADGVGGNREQFGARGNALAPNRLRILHPHLAEVAGPTGPRIHARRPVPLAPTVIVARNGNLNGQARPPPVLIGPFVAARGQRCGKISRQRREPLVAPRASDFRSQLRMLNLVDEQPVAAVVAPDHCSCRKRCWASTRALAMTLASVTSAPCRRLLSSAASMKA